MQAMDGPCCCGLRPHSWPLLEPAAVRLHHDGVKVLGASVG